MAGTNGLVSCLDVDDWQYRAEGNGSVVMFSSKKRTILRVRKTTGKKSSQESSHETCDDKWRLLHDFVQSVIEPLLGSEYVCLPKIVPVTKDFFESIVKRLEPQRPEKRLNMKLDIRKTYVLSFPDFCFLPSAEKLLEKPTFCVEIKPKRGFLPRPRHHIPASLPINNSVCCFCLHQYFKVRHGVWEKPSHYCPLDLFSCDPARMKYCLNMLLENPQNNLRIFKNGVTIYEVQETSTPSLQDQEELIENLREYFGDSNSKEGINAKPLESSFVQSFLDVIIEILLSHNAPNGMALPVKTRQQLDPETCAESGYSDYYTARYPTRVKVQVNSSCILRRLLAAQSLSVLEIDVILPLYRKVLKHLEEHPADSKKYSLDFPYEEYFSLSESETRSTLQLLEDETLGVSEVAVRDAVQMIREFLITRTFKDCSIMVAVQPITDNHESASVPLLRASNGNSYLCSVNAIDFDPKPSSRIPRYEELDTKIAQEYVTRQQNGTQAFRQPAVLNKAK